MLKKSIAAILFAVVAFLIAALMGWVHIGGVSRQPLEAQPSVAAEQSPVPEATNPPPGNGQEGGAPVSHLAQDQLEAEFFKTRDALRKKSAKDPSGAIAPTDELKRKLEAVVGTFKVVGFPPAGRVSPHLVGNDPCCLPVDSLEFTNDKGETLFVTTKGLVRKFLPQVVSPHDYLSAVVPLDEFAAMPEQAAKNYADLPVHGANKEYFVSAFVATYNVGDRGMPVAPDTIMVFVFAGDRIFFMYGPVESPEIPECTEKWSDLHDKASVPLDAFEASGQKDQKLLEKGEQLEADAIDAAISCYQREAKNQPFFASLVKQAQSMVDRIHPE